MGASLRAKKAELIHIEVDRRLGHEWDEWNGKPLPNQGHFYAPPGRFFRYAALTIAAACAVLYALWYILAPRLGAIWSALPYAMILTFAAASILAWTSDIANAAIRKTLDEIHVRKFLVRRRQ